MYDYSDLVVCNALLGCCDQLGVRLSDVIKNEELLDDEDFGFLIVPNSDYKILLSKSLRDFVVNFI